jgi:peptide/nickel transport system ATP-binding protein
MVETVVSTRSLKKYFLATKHGLLEVVFRREPLFVRAVDDVSIDVKQGEILALVGESGSGKTTLGRLLTTLEHPTGGELYFMGEKVASKDVNKVRQQVQMVFQNPLESLDPRMTIRDIVTEPISKQRVDRQEKERMLEAALMSVGLDPSIYKFRRPRDLSGGQRQRVALARAIISNPKFVVLDEPTSALDASVQAQVLNLLLDLHDNYKFTYIVITHNISVARFIADRLAVMYAGKIVEIGPTEEIINSPKHPYTQALLKSLPKLEARGMEPPKGEVPSLVRPPNGCRFHPRCQFAMEICKTTEPGYFAMNNAEVACWLYGEVR